MKTKDYIKTFGLDNRDWDRKAFIAKLGEEFREKVNLSIQARKNQDLEYTFDIFMHQVKEIQEKFWSISAHKSGEPFTKNLFSAFYATVVLPIRKEFFPEKDAEIRKARKEAQKREKEKQDNGYLD